jgi:hypothetical protein
MDPGLIPAVESEPFVRWVGPYEPSYRLTPELLADLYDLGGFSRRFRLQTFVADASEKTALATEVVEVGGQVITAEPPGYIVEAMLTDGQALELLSSNNLQWLEEWTPVGVDMDNGRVVAGADYLLELPSISGIRYDGSGVRAEVMDTYVDSDHPDFINPVPIHGAVQPAGPSHGTSVYGINFGNGSGSATATGMVPGAYGYFAYYDTVYNNAPQRYIHTAELVDPSLEYQCVYQTNSWGNTQVTDYNTYSHEMDDMIWLNDITIFQSQSNTGNQTSRPQAWAKNIIAVGGARHLDNTNPDDDYWSGASVGPAADGRIKPDLTYFYDSIRTTADGGGYTNTFNGTSGATPMAAGTSGLFFQMWAANEWGTRPGSGSVFDKRPHFTTMKALLINTASQYDWTTTNPSLTRFRQGWGYPNARTAYDRADMTAVIDETSVLGEFQADVHYAEVPSSQDELKVTMVYADRAGTTSSSIHRINDVTLSVIAPNGTVYWGNNGLTNGIWSTPGGSADTLNTVENVFIQNPEEGRWTIEIIAAEVNMDVHAETPEDDQDYALVVYGVTDFVVRGGNIFSDGFESGDISAWANAAP